jgi:peptide/nickel transport system ATP-binding protein
MTDTAPSRQPSGRHLAVEVRDLRVDMPGGVDIVDDVSFRVEAGQVLGIVGESGSGKTTVGMALLGFARGGAQIRAGSITIGGEDNRNVLGLGSGAWRALRGKVISYVPQDPASALNPALRLRLQLAEVVRAHEPEASEADILQRVRDVLEAVRLPSTDAFLDRFVHQLSGGQQQRIGIAMAVILKPKLIVLDEPTTGLDVSTQNRVLELVKTLCQEHGIGAIYIAHDLSVIAHIADQVMVMYSGRVVELGDVDTVFQRPSHPYTQALLGAVPELRRRTVLSVIPGTAPRPANRPPGCFFRPRCAMSVEKCEHGPIPLARIGDGQEARCLRANEVPRDVPPSIADTERISTDAVLEVTGLKVAYGKYTVLDGVNFKLYRGECLALVGESGSGKSTLARCLIGLVPHQRIQILLNNRQIAGRVRERSDQERRSLQYIFQSPHNALNPRQTAGNSIGLVYDTFVGGKAAERDAAIAAVLQPVGLAPELAAAYPDQLSGWERQRVAIARALIADPEVLICDEITSALDVSVQAAIVNLLMELQTKRGMSLLFVTHNIALVRNIADRMMVLNRGQVVEIGSTGSVIENPTHEYTRALLADTLEHDVEHRVKAGRGAAAASSEAATLPLVS